jgi:cation diffusion facilitator CzcD-associated flavoprotein CzcO
VFSRIQIYEQRDRVGGIWNLCSDPERSRRIPIPQTDPRYGHHRHRASVDNDDGEDVGGESLEFESPLYDYLETNIPKPLMAYSEKPFDDDLPLFPSWEQTLRYIEEYAEDVKHLIKFRHQVCDVNLVSRSSEGLERWKVEVQDLSNGDVSNEFYDAVIVANGHYTIPSVPFIKGLEAWNRKHPGSIIHSKAYRKPEDYRGKKVLVIGNSASGLDIAYQVGQECKQPVLLSSRSVSAFGSVPQAAWRKDVDEVVEFMPAKRAVRFQSGGIESDIDAVIFATGYFYSYPFLSNIHPPVVTDGLRVQNVYYHLFNIDHPTIVFPVINLKVIPFPLAENQAAVVSRIFSGRLDLPSKREMRRWEENNIKEKGNGKYFHLMRFPEDCAQINDLHEWALMASKKEGLENDGNGKLGTAWHEKQVLMRSKFGEIKGKYVSRGAERVRATSIEQLGFAFDFSSKQGKSQEQMELLREAHVRSN